MSAPSSSPTTAFVSLGRARVGTGASLRARASGVPGAPGHVSVTPLRPDQPMDISTTSPTPAFVAFGRARTGAGSALRARSSGIPGTPGRGAVTRRRTRSPAIVSTAGENVGRARGLGLGVDRSAARSDGEALAEAWEIAAGCGDVLGMVRAVRAGYDDVGSTLRVGRFAGGSAVHAGAGLAREDVIACVFEMARGVGARAGVYGHRGAYAREVIAAADVRGRTALHYAADCDWSCVEQRFIVDVVRKLVGYGVGLLDRDDEGRTARELAEMCGNAAAVRALREGEMGMGG